MAIFTIPGQNISYTIPDDGQVFRDMYDSSAVYVRTGNSIQALSFEQLGRRKLEETLAKYGINLPQNGSLTLPTPTGDEYKRIQALLEQIRRENPDVNFNSTWGNNGFNIGYDGRAAESMGRQIFEQQSGVSYNSLDKILTGDVQQAIKSMGGSWSGTEDFNVFRSTPKSTGEVFTLTPNASNPHAQVITSNQQGTVYDPVAQGIAPSAPQAGALGFNAQTMVNPNQGGPSTYTQPALTGAAATAATGAVALPNNGSQTPSVNQDFFLKPGETPDQYNERIAASYANLPAPGTTSSTGVTNTAVPASQRNPDGTVKSPVTSTGVTTPAGSSPLTSDMFNNVATPSFKTQNDYLSTAQLTPMQQDVQNRITSLTQLNNQNAERGQFEAQLRQSTGLSDAENRLTALTNEAKQIPLQVQQNFEGRGVTKAGLQPIETGALRNNAIQSLAAATQLDQIRKTFEDQVQAKFGPIEAQIKAATDNLNLIINSPAYTQQEKAQAQARLNYQSQINAAIQQQKDNQLKIEKIAIDAALTGKVDEATLYKIRNATSPIDAAQIASPFLQEVTSASGISGTPNSYKEWVLAGQPGTYEQWLEKTGTKAPTVAQQTVSTYAARLEQSTPTISSLQNTIAGMNVLSFEAQSRLPSYLQTSTFQQYDQASRNFINAVLRRESGAVISQSEFDNAYRQYLPRPGDSAATLQQKQQNREIVYQSFKTAAGSAYQSVNDLLGGGSTTSNSNPLGI